MGCSGCILVDTPGDVVELHHPLEATDWSLACLPIARPSPRPASKEDLARAKGFPFDHPEPKRFVDATQCALDLLPQRPSRYGAGRILDAVGDFGAIDRS